MKSALPRTSTLAFLFALAVASGVTGCDRAPSASGLPEWTPKDHERGEESARAAQGQSPATGKPKKASPEEEAAEVAELTWSTQCSTCHGRDGKGDGPQGPMVKAPDLTRPDWQDKVKDADIAATIRAGKGQMPKFDVSEPVLAALTKRIRKRRAP